jgi:hypothetical protein
MTDDEDPNKRRRQNYTEQVDTTYVSCSAYANIERQLMDFIKKYEPSGEGRADIAEAPSGEHVKASIIQEEKKMLNTLQKLLCKNLKPKEPQMDAATLHLRRSASHTVEAKEGHKLDFQGIDE